ncbi:hypothetical protein SMC37_000336 [Cronobacter sakazakii]|uniref:hypothetical protein n=1 Tax=Cronobacter sakazakii TaxID=28141 RepID=UPI00025F6568|nr:hypothetical protein [Cronobacter sakazakii]AFJ99470.1 hypothetical protein ES15_1897 [Cronobacter sakazakii ES15]EKK5242432.1 hypothetical protein [Cronobacter sakazakii]ELY2475648.1 hypothetical protein [Cronobacter sakazakii]ELY2731127.1 hypothetical protein [Cronobacter sakazakii]ELY4529699.1 hypothetical protein [Cronobacter sakazakii]
MNIAEIVENRGSFSGEEFTICDPKRNKTSGVAQKVKRAAKQTGTAGLTRPPCAVWFTGRHTKILWRSARCGFRVSLDDDVAYLSVLLILFCYQVIKIKQLTLSRLPLCF